MLDNQYGDSSEQVLYIYIYNSLQSKNYPSVKMIHKLLNRFYHMLLYYSPYQSRNGEIFINLVTKYKMENYRGNMTFIPTLKTPAKE